MKNDKIISMKIGRERGGFRTYFFIYKRYTDTLSGRPQKKREGKRDPN